LQARKLESSWSSGTTRSSQKKTSLEMQNLGQLLYGSLHGIYFAGLHSLNSWMTGAEQNTSAVVFERLRMIVRLSPVSAIDERREHRGWRSFPLLFRVSFEFPYLSYLLLSACATPTSTMPPDNFLNLDVFREPALTTCPTEHPVDRSIPSNCWADFLH
jgi:hypothetical protein